MQQYILNGAVQRIHSERLSIIHCVFLDTQTWQFIYLGTNGICIGFSSVTQKLN